MTGVDGWPDPVELLDIKVDNQSHILITDKDACGKSCEHQPCTFICPTEVYGWDGEKAMLTVNYSRCIECYACVPVCPYHNIAWHYPRGGFGVAFKF